MAAEASALHPAPAPLAADFARPRLTAWARREVITALLLIACASTLYFWRLDQPRAYVYDEVYHAYTIAQLAAGNPDAYLWYTEPPEDARARRLDYEWVHPAMAKLFMQVGVFLFGDNSFGWRFSSAVFGALGIGLLYLLGRTLFDHTIGLFAAILMLLDGLWFVQSRTAMNDVFVVFFLMAGYLAFARYLKSPIARRWSYLWLTGVALGLALATKWSAIYSFGLIALLAVGREAWLRRQGQTRAPVRTALGLIAVFGVVPFALYLEGYVQFFLMGHTWETWRELQWQIWRYHSGLKACHDWSSPGWSWPFMLRPVWYYVHRAPDGLVANVFAMGNPLIWWAFLSAIAVVGVRWVGGRLRVLGLGLILAAFLVQWLPWFLSPRVAYLYHMLPSVPFGCLAVAYLLGVVRQRRLIVGAYLTLVALSFLFFYSHYSALPVPVQFANLHNWLPTWEPGSLWAFNCPPLRS